MIIIFGIRRLRKSMGAVRLRCANCGMSPLVLFRVSTWFALFFIPLIPLSFRHHAACPNCKRVDVVSKADIERARAQEAAIKTGGQEATVDVAPRTATLERAVNQWAAVGQAQAGAMDAAPVSTTSSATPAAASPPPVAPAGWYPDPVGNAGQRYWDGRQWTEETGPMV